MSDLNLDDVSQDVDNAKAVPTTETLSSLATLARSQLEVEQSIEEIEELLKSKKELLRDLSEVKIPEVFAQLGISEFKLNNGLKVRVSPYYSGKADSDQAFDWLEENGHADIIKGEFTVMYRRSDKSKISSFNAMAAQLGFSVKDKLAVHPMTMKSFVKEQIEEGINIPRDIFNIYTGFKTKIGK